MEKRTFDLRELSCCNLGDVFPGINKSPPIIGYTGSKALVQKRKDQFKESFGERLFQSSSSRVLNSAGNNAMMTGNSGSQVLNYNSSHANINEINNIASVNSNSRIDDSYFIIGPSKIPVLGYSGWFRGKHEGRIGKPELPHESISMCDFNAEDEETSMILATSMIQNTNKGHVDLEPSSEESRNLSYDLAIDESSSSGHNIERLLRDIKVKIEIKYNLLSMKYKFVKKPFNMYDPMDTGYISAHDCRLCLSRLNLIIPRVQFLCLMSYFDEHKDGTFAWKKFLHAVCPTVLLDSDAQHIDGK